MVGANALVQLDDDVLAGGNAGGTGDDIDAANLTGTLSGEGGDIPLTWAFQLTGAPAGFNYVSNGAGGVLIQQGGITVLTVTLNPANGAYTVTQNAPIDHAAGGDENNQGFTLAYTVTDVDGGSAAGTFAIDVDDDTPVASAADHPAGAGGRRDEPGDQCLGQLRRRVHHRVRCRWQRRQRSPIRSASMPVRPALSTPPAARRSAWS